MISRSFLFEVFAVGTLLLPAVGFGQDKETFHHLTLSAAAGLTTITGTDAGKLDHGANVELNGGYFQSLPRNHR